MKTLNILFIIYDLERGGPELRLLNFVKYFPDYINIHICVTSNDLSLLEKFKNYAQDIKVIPIDRPYLEITKLIKISRYCRINNISIVNSYDLKGLIISCFLKVLYRKRILTVFNNVNSLKSYTKRQKSILKYLLFINDWILCNSKFSKNEIKSKYMVKNTSVVYNGVDIDYFQNNSHNEDLFDKYKLHDNNFIIGTVANFRKQKNYQLLISAFKRVSKGRPDMKLFCVGGGPELSRIKALARAYSLENQIIFTGYVENVYDYLKIFNVFVLTSTSEGMPNVIIEAMCIGVPVISSNVGGCAEIIDHNRDGLLFESNDIDNFVVLINKLIADTELKERLRKSSVDKVTSKFSVKTMIDNYVKFYNNLELLVNKSG